ncbi:hypothetical protein BDY19DRAFT_940221 [Irpex rosettiformis]|uniref:Uncharacterized protein n=1 Tax=Irpex rosettiformis TaxID=378272 RepID=A0ACB8U847_9APHY|nr:hypothetical protein BDY19DRAFT_940221 [Irpex rosettiformis]
MSKSPVKAPASSLAAFLNALSWARIRSAKDPDFDAGLNSSSAWTESLSNPVEGVLRASIVHQDESGVESGEPNVNSLSDDEDEPAAVTSQANEDGELEAETGRAARALYVFEGKPEFRELTFVQAGDRLEVLREDFGDGWSLVKYLEGPEGHTEVGLIPHSYYAFTSDFVQAPDLNVTPTHSRYASRKETSASSITPRSSPKKQTELLPIIPPLVPQTTGEWFPSFRRSLLGGKQFNRFSTFVTSGAEEWLLNGSDGQAEVSLATNIDHVRESSVSSTQEDDGYNDGVGEADRHFVDAGPSWRPKVPSFKIMVHSPSKRSSILSGAYTIYSVTSIFGPDVQPPETGLNEERPGSPVRITVHRRFSHFVALHTALSRRLPGIALPPLPEKQYAGRFNDDFVEARRGDLQRYLQRVVRHPVARYAEVLTFFLGCESDSEWKKQYPRYLAYPPAGPSFYAHVYHPAFNFDQEEAIETVDKFASHVQAVGQGVQSLRTTFGKVREVGVEMSKAQRLLAYTLLSLITSTPLNEASTPSIPEEEEHDGAKSTGHMNSDGAWCWREGCTDCLKLTKAMQKTSDTLQTVADLYDDHARRTQLVTHEAFKSVAHPASIFSGVVETHRSTLSRYTEGTTPGAEDEELAARCETVLNTTMAEFDTYHDQKLEDFEGLTKDFLDSEIRLHEQILARLKSARLTFNEPTYSTLSLSPRAPSMYERDLTSGSSASALSLANKPALTHPCPHVHDSTPMRPVSVAIQGVQGAARASVFGRFW